MTYSVVILGSTGSIGNSTLDSIKKRKNYKVKLLTANKNIKKLLSQCIKYNVKNAIIEDEVKYNKYKFIFKKNKINLHHGFRSINKIIKYKVSFCINSISGIEGLEPTLNIIPFSKNILIANKETIICGWHIILKELKKYNTEFIPIDSEHFSIWKLIKNEKKEIIDKIILTASGGPFLNVPKRKIINIKPFYALRHPNWKMGKKISIDSATMMNKIFEFLEAKKIFNLSKNKLSIIIHPSSYVHAIIYLKGNIIKLLAHEPLMTIPISNALGIVNNNKNNNFAKQIKNLNSLKFENPKKKIFPLLSLIDLIPEKDSYFETILITINDILVNRYLHGKINYISIHKNLLRLIKRPYLTKFYKLKPKNIYDIKKIIKLTGNYLDKRIKYYEK